MLRAHWLIGEEARNEEARALWQRFHQEDASASAMAGPAWWSLMTDTFGSHDEQRMLVLESGGTPFALWPLAVRVEKGRLASRRTLIGANGHHTYYNEPLVGSDAPADIIHQLRDAALRAPAVDLIDLTRLRREGLVQATRLTSVLPSSDRRLTLSETPAHLRGQPGRELNRLRRQLSSVGEVAITRVAGVAVADLASDFTSLHTALKRMQNQWAVFADHPGSSERFGDALRHAAPALDLGGISLSVDGIPRGITLFARRGGEASSWRVAWDPALARYGLGSILFSEVIAWGRERGDHTLRLGPGDEPYKLKWASENDRVFRWRGARPTPIGLFSALRRRVASER